MNSVDKFKMDFQVYGMETSLVQPNVLLIILWKNCFGVIYMNF